MLDWHEMKLLKLWKFWNWEFSVVKYYCQLFPAMLFGLKDHVSVDITLHSDILQYNWLLLKYCVGFCYYGQACCSSSGAFVVGLVIYRLNGWRAALSGHIANCCGPVFRVRNPCGKKIKCLQWDGYVPSLGVVFVCGFVFVESSVTESALLPYTLVQEALLNKRFQLNFYCTHLLFHSVYSVTLV